jgi:membrane fusion protein
VQSTMNKTPPLFRQVAVEASLGTQIGEALAAHWRGVRIFTVLAFVLTGGLVGFIATVEYSPVYRVPCYVDVRDGLARLAAPADGQIAHLSVREGSRVMKDDLLAVLSSDKLRQGGDSQHSAVKQKLEAENSMIEREIDAANKEAAANRDMIDRRIAGLKSERDATGVDIGSKERLLNSLQAQTEQMSSLVGQGYVSKLQIAQKHDEVTLQESRLASSRATLTRIDRDISTSEAERSLVGAKLAEVIENRHRAVGELERLALESDAQAEQVVRAPMDGTVSTAQIVEGQSVKAGQLMFTVAPAGKPLIARLLVPGRAAAVVKPGMDVRFVLRAYPREKFGDFAAHIESVSDTPSLPGDVMQVLSIAETAFTATATLSGELRGPDGRALWLKPGMIGEALVPIERRTVLEWLLDPILRGFNRPAPAATVANLGPGIQP